MHPLIQELLSVEGETNKLVPDIEFKTQVTRVQVLNKIM